MATASTTPRQIPIVCPGHTRPLAELQFLSPPPPPPPSSNDPESGSGIDEAGDTYLLSACHDKMPMIRNATSGDWIGTFSGHKGAVWSIKLDPMGYLAATASGDFSVKVWDGVTGKELFTYPHRHIVKSVDFSPDSRRLATGGHEGILRVFDLEQGAKAEPREMHQLTTGKKVNITKCLWLNDGLVLAAASDGHVRGWNVNVNVNGNGNGSAGEEGGNEMVCDLAVRGGAEVRDMEVTTLSGGGQTILTVAAGDTVSFFALSLSSVPWTVRGSLLHEHKMPIHFREEGGASLHPSGTKFVAGGSDLWVRVFDFESGKEMECHRGHHGPIRCLRYSPDGTHYATGSEDGTIRLWKTDVVVSSGDADADGNE